MQHHTKDSNLRTIIASNIRHYTENSSRSQDVFAKVMGVSTKQIQRYKAGSSEPTAAALYLLSEFLLIDVNIFFKERR